MVNKDLIISKDDYEYKLKDKSKFIGHRGDSNNPNAVIIKIITFTLKLLLIQKHSAPRMILLELVT